jgi:hypothetical protein
MPSDATKAVVLAELATVTGSEDLATLAQEYSKDIFVSTGGRSLEGQTTLRELCEGPCARVHMTPKVRCGGGPGGDTTDTTAVKRSLRTCRGQQAKVPSDADSEPEESMSKRVSRLTAHARTHPRTNGF